MDEHTRLPADQPFDMEQASLPTGYIDGFWDMLRKAYELAKKDGLAPDGQFPKLIEEYPKNRQGQFDQSFDIIEYHVVGVEPAGMATDGTNRVPTRPQERQTIEHPTKAGYLLTRYEWWEWITVEFLVLSKTNRGANSLAKWFHFFILRWGQALDFLRARGIQKFQFVGRGPDQQTNKYGDNPLWLRPMRYKFRLAIQDAFETKVLDSLNIEVNGVPYPTLTNPRSG